jgi:hypothetical protein
MERGDAVRGILDREMRNAEGAEKCGGDGNAQRIRGHHRGSEVTEMRWKESCLMLLLLACVLCVL